MDFNFISKAFLATLGGVPVTLLIMVVSILLSFLPALFLALGQIYKVKGVRSFSVIYLAFIRATPPILLILFFYSLFPSLLNSFFKSIGSHFNVFEINPIYYAFSKWLRQRRKVVFPDPDGPKITTTSPWLTLRLTSTRTWWSLNFFDTCSTSNIFLFLLLLCECQAIF